MRASAAWRTIATDTVSWTLLLGLFLGVAGTSAAQKQKGPAIPAAVISFPEQAQLGNIFTAGEKVVILARVAQGDRVTWTLKDFEGNTVSTGRADVKDQKVSIAPDVPANGFYLLALTSETAGKPVGEAVTSLAITPVVDIKALTNSKFGVNTHFEQGMSVEVFSKFLAPGCHETVDRNITVRKGSQVDFVITPGPKADTNFDNTAFRVTLLTPATKPGAP